MEPKERLELMQYRLDVAQEKLKAASILYEEGCFKDAINRSYYSIFSAMRAVLALDEIDYSKHAGVISYFQREYIKTKIFDKVYSKYISEAFRIRSNCDYADFFLVSKEDAETQLTHAQVFLEEVKRYLAKRTKG